MTNEDQTQHDRCILAIHDIGTRDGMTSARMMRELRKEGFTAEQIKKALREFM